MKIVEEFYKEITDSKQLQNELKTVSGETLDAFLREHNCDATAKDFIEFIRSKIDGEIVDDVAEAIAGGGLYSRPGVLPTSYIIV